MMFNQAQARIGSGSCSSAHPPQQQCLCAGATRRAQHTPSRTHSGWRMPRALRDDARRVNAEALPAGGVPWFWPGRALALLSFPFQP